MKTVFIAHPISMDIKGNTEKILAICRELHSHDIIPVAPYLVSLQYLNDEMVEDRQLGVSANMECFHRRYIDELWLYGNCISSGMKEEVELARSLGIPIIPMTKETKQDFEKSWG